MKIWFVTEEAQKQIELHLSRIQEPQEPIGTEDLLAFYDIKFQLVPPEWFCGILDADGDQANMVCIDESEFKVASSICGDE